jgi:hypothetical protein
MFGQCLAPSFLNRGIVAEHVGLSVVAADNLKTLWVVTPLHPLQSGHSPPSELILGPECNDPGREKGGEGCMALPELVQPDPAREPNLREQTPTLCVNGNSTVSARELR